MAVILLQGVSKVYPNGIQAVRELSLEVHSQELFVLLGPSGCGKTTTLRLIAGLEELSQGAIQLGGQVVTHVPPHRRDVAMLFQSPALYPHLTVRKNLAFGRSVSYNPLSWWSRRPAAEMRQIESTARLLGVEKLLDRKPAELSGGERQRAALGRALLRHPAVFLLDEPLAHADPTLRSQLRRDLRTIQTDQRATMIWVTHDHAEALAVADRIGVMEAGGLLQVGAPAEVYERPASIRVARLIGQPPMNRASGALLSQARQTTAEVIGIRPQDVRIESAGQGIQMTVIGTEYGEPMGHVFLKHDDLELTACVAAGVKLEVGASVSVSWEWSKVHRFERTTGLRLETPPG